MWHATCEMCRQSQFSPDGVTAYTVRNKAIEFVMLNGKEPWSGVRIVCDACIGQFKPILAARLASLEQQLAAALAREKRLRHVLEMAWTDIGQWLQLARYQREQMDQNLGWCPTQAGLDASTAMREEISAALAEPADDAGEPPGTGAIGYPEACRYCGVAGIWLETMPPICTRCGRKDIEPADAEGGGE